MGKTISNIALVAAVILMALGVWFSQAYYLNRQVTGLTDPNALPAIERMQSRMDVIIPLTVVAVLVLVAVLLDSARREIEGSGFTRKFWSAIASSLLLLVLTGGLVAVNGMFDDSIATALADFEVAGAELAAEIAAESPPLSEEDMAAMTEEELAQMQAAMQAEIGVRVGSEPFFAATETGVNAASVAMLTLVLALSMSSIAIAFNRSTAGEG